MPRPVIYFFLAALLLFGPKVYAQNSLNTQYTTLHYSDDAELHEFLWRLTGQKMSGDSVPQLARNRVDEIVERVQTLLDMRPAAFHFDIYLKKKHTEGAIAYYSHETRSITAAANRVTDGVLAHEIAHAIMNAYFSPAPPEKSQEVLAQYVDQHLWSEVV